MITVVQTVVEEGPLQNDGVSRHVTERHVMSDGRTAQYVYLAGAGMDAQVVAQARAQRLQSEIQAREAALNEAANGATPLTKYQFRQLFTYPERLAIDAFNHGFEAHPSLTTEQKAAIRTNLEDYNVSGAVYLDNPATIAGVQLYEALGLIASGRAAEILSGSA